MSDDADPTAIDPSADKTTKAPRSARRDPEPRA